MLLLEACNDVLDMGNNLVKGSICWNMQYDHLCSGSVHVASSQAASHIPQVAMAIYRLSSWTIQELPYLLVLCLI